MTSFILLLTIIIDTHFTLFKDLSKAFTGMTNINGKYINTYNLILKKTKCFRRKDKMSQSSHLNRL